MNVLIYFASDTHEACEDHNILTNWWRSTGYENDDWDHSDICDDDLASGWYRAVSDAGGDMPREPPGLNRCGTTYPLWLKGKNGKPVNANTKDCRGHLIYVYTY